MTNEQYFKTQTIARSLKADGSMQPILHLKAVCVLTLDDGESVFGESASQVSEHFDYEAAKIEAKALAQASINLQLKSITATKDGETTGTKFDFSDGAVVHISDQEARLPQWKLNNLLAQRKNPVSEGAMQ